MKRTSRDEYLDVTLRALVAFFGIEAVTRAMADIEGKVTEPRRPRSDPPARITLPRAVAELAKSDPRRFDLLRPFFEKIMSGELLPQSEDIRRFAEHLRVKELLPGRSRRDLVVKLTGPLVAMPLNELPALLKEADSIFEEQRRKGYSLLTDRLLRPTHRPAYWCQPDVASAWLKATGWTVAGNRARRGRSNIPAPQPHALYDLHDVAVEEDVGASEVVKQIVAWAGQPNVAGDAAHPPSSAQMALLAEGKGRAAR